VGVDAAPVIPHILVEVEKRERRVEESALNLGSLSLFRHKSLEHLFLDDHIPILDTLKLPIYKCAEK
jgi:hypothetical protein